MLERGQCEGSELPRPWKFSFKLLRNVLDYDWSFDEHVEGLETKAVRRLSALSRLASCTWVWGSRILSITASTLFVSIINCGLSAYGAHSCQRNRNQLDVPIL